MRTNTWLAILTVGQGLQMIQASGHHRELMGQLKQMDAAQAERDRVRDEKFDRAAAIAQRGQFAMWIQSPEGQIFERWAQHAIAASQQLEDRQTAWEFAWYAEQIAAWEADPEFGSAKFGSHRPWDDIRWHHQLEGPQVHAASRQLDLFAGRASELLPRPTDLFPLAGLYHTFDAAESQLDRPLPRALKDLIDRFREDDEARVSQLRADGFR